MIIKWYFDHRYYRAILIKLFSNTDVGRRYSRFRQISRYVTLFTIVFIFTIGYSNFIFQSKLHIPWLANVQLSKTLVCQTNITREEWPQAVDSDIHPMEKNDRLTVVVVTARPEFKRLPLTLVALVCHLDPRRLHEVMFLVPPQDLILLRPFLVSTDTNRWPWPISIVSDDVLLKHRHTHSYRLQMIFKLVLAQIVKTEYYMILDSDCVALWPIHVEQLLWRQKNTTKDITFKALYSLEHRSTHSRWWLESERLLQIESGTCVSADPTSTVMGVTPLILSRTIALRTLCRLKMLYGDQRFLNKLANWGLWQLVFGRMWTEYTLYYLTSQCTHTFHKHHFHYSEISARVLDSVNLCGHSIWSYDDWTPSNRRKLVELVNAGLQWRQKEIDLVNGQLIIDNGRTHSLFSVLQGRQNINPNLYHQLLFPIYVHYLKQQNNTLELVTTLNRMTEQLIHF